MKVSRDQVYDVSPAELWDIVGDPYKLARWWPRVERIESVDDAGYTEVYRTKNGRTVRADYRIAALEDQRELRVVQQLQGTPFAQILDAAGKRFLLEPADGGTRVTVELDQQPARLARFGGFMVKRAMRKQLKDGLDALGLLVG